MNALYYISILPIGSEKLVRIDSQVYRLTDNRQEPQNKKIWLKRWIQGRWMHNYKKNIVSFKENWHKMKIWPQVSD